MPNGTTTRLGNHGRLVIPSEIRKQLNLKDGDQVQISVVEGRVVITPPTTLMEEFFELTKPVRLAGVDVVQELIDERHEEAARE